MKRNQTDFLKTCLADALIKIMKTQAYDTINVCAVCERAGVGRTTFYRHFGGASCKEELLRFKLLSEWERYKERHEDEFKRDKNFTLLNFIYENRKLFTLLNDSGVIHIIICLCENLADDDFPPDRGGAYLKAFTVHGQFGIILQWIEYGFDETPEQSAQHVFNTLLAKFKQENE